MFAGGILSAGIGTLACVGLAVLMGIALLMGAASTLYLLVGLASGGPARGAWAGDVGEGVEPGICDSAGGEGLDFDFACGF